MFVAIIAFLPLIIFAQKDISAKNHFFRNEISLVSDNDNYTLLGRDGYYTNGIYLKLSHAVDIENSKWYKNKPNIKKVITGFEFGQAIYNPVSYNRPFPEYQDRPFAGYLAFTFGQYIFLKKNTVLEYAVSLGTIGPNSFGKNVQRWYHNVIGIYDVVGWPYELNNEASINLKTAWYQSLLKTDPQKSQFNIDGFAKANLGNAFTNLSVGGTFKVGMVENHCNSDHWKARLSTKNGSKAMGNHELYFYYEPALTYQAYNAVLQGGMFLKNKGPLTASIKPVFFSQQFGVRYAKNRFGAALTYVNRTRQATTQIRNENFVSLQVGYKIKKL